MQTHSKLYRHTYLFVYPSSFLSPQLLLEHVHILESRVSGAAGETEVHCLLTAR